MTLLFGYNSAGKSALPLIAESIRSTTGTAIATVAQSHGLT
jgi:hypothetical protein